MAAMAALKRANIISPPLAECAGAASDVTTRWMEQEEKGSRLFQKIEPLHHGVDQALAAAAGERERIQQYGADLLVELFAHQPPCAVQPGLHRLRTQAKDVRGIFDAHAFNDSCDEDNA